MKEKIIDLINNKNLNILKNELEKMNAHDISDLFEKLTDEEMIITFRLLSKTKAVETFAYMEIDQKEALINAITDKELSSIVNELFMDDAVDLIAVDIREVMDGLGEITGEVTSSDILELMFSNFCVGK